MIFKKNPKQAVLADWIAWSKTWELITLKKTVKVSLIGSNLSRINSFSTKQEEESFV